MVGDGSLLFCYTEDMLTVSRKAQARAQLTRDLAEIHQYTKDLEAITAIRNLCFDETERQRYTEIIKIMQLVVTRLNKKLGDHNGRLSSMEE